MALVPAPFLTNPKGVRGVADWYMLSAEEPNFLKKLFDRQAEIALQNMAKLHQIAGDFIDVVVVCGTDFVPVFQDQSLRGSSGWANYWHELDHPGKAANAQTDTSLHLNTTHQTNQNKK